MPQIDQIAAIYASQLFWLVVVFGLIYFGIGRAMLPKIQGTVDSRDARISSDLAAAKQARAEADVADDYYARELARGRAEAQAAAATAKSQATAVAEGRLHAADADIARRVGHAEAALAEARARAVAEIELIAVDATQDIVARVAGIGVDRAAAAQAVVAVLAHG